MTDNNLLLYVFTFFITLIITVCLLKKLIPALSQKAKQPIYSEGPSWHLKKSGTPTMGGLSFLIASFISGSFASLLLFVNGERYHAISLLLIIMYGSLNSVIGIIDDYTKLKRHDNAGLSPKQKLLLQAVLAILFLLARSFILKDSSSIRFAYGSLDLGIFYYPLAFLALLGTVNCANLTDGIDGLASGVAFAIGLSLFYLSFASGSDISVISAILIASALGFLVFNVHPAKIFMGDTGSLFFGAIISSAAVSLGNFLIILFIGAVYLLEGISVIIQVVFFKITGKRVLLMSPIHHHFEKRGWSENKIVLASIFLTLLFSIPAFIIFV